MPLGARITKVQGRDVSTKAEILAELSKYGAGPVVFTCAWLVVGASLPPPVLSRLTAGWGEALSSMVQVRGGRPPSELSVHP